MIRLIKPYITYKDVKRKLETVFETGFFTKGKFADEFQKDLTEYIECESAFLTTSCTTALSLSLEIVGVKSGDEVIVSDFSFPASSNVIENIGAIPVFADVDSKTFNMSASDLKSKITQNTKAVIFVDALGNPSGVHEIKSICSNNNIPLIEDAACAVGSSENGIKCGNISDITCFSFHPRKLLTTGEGGAITTNNLKFSELLKIKLNHGAIMENDKMEFIESGFNYRMTEIQAIMGIEGLKKLDYVIKERDKIKNKYINKLRPLGFTPQFINNNSTSNIQSLVFNVPKGVNRDALIRELKYENIETTIGAYCLSGTTYYKNKYKDIQRTSEYLQNNTITLPCYSGVEIDEVIKAIKRHVA